MSIGLRLGEVGRASFPRSSADLDHGFRDRFLKSPSPRDAAPRDGDEGSREPEPWPPSWCVLVRPSDKSYTDLLALGMFSVGSGRSWSRMGRGSVGWEIFGFLAELVLGRGSFELVEERPGSAPLETDRVNHFVGLKS